MKRFAVLAALALCACPPQLDPHGTVCNVDSDCAPTLVCINRLCGDAPQGGGGGGGGAGGGGVGGGTGGGGLADAGVMLHVMSINPTAGDGGPCSGGDGTQTQRSDGTPVQCGDTPYCALDGGALSLPWQPAFLLVAQVVGEPWPDIVAVEGSNVHVFENLGGLDFAERLPPLSLHGLSPMRAQVACLNSIVPRRTVLVSGIGPDGGTVALDAGTMRDGGNGELWSCDVRYQDCSQFETDVVDFTNGAVDDGGYDAVVVVNSQWLLQFDSHLTMRQVNRPFFPVQVLGDLFYPTTQPDSYYSGYNSFGEVMTSLMVTGDDVQGSAQIRNINGIALKLARDQDNQAVVAFYKGQGIPDGFQFLDLDESGNLTSGTVSPAVTVLRLVTGDFSLDAGASRPAVLVVTATEVQRWPFYFSSFDNGLDLLPVETVYNGSATDLALGDLDGDGANDLVIAVGNSLMILKGR